MGVSDLLRIMEHNGKYLIGVTLSEYPQVFINFAMESMGVENIPLHRGEDSDDSSYLKEVNA